MKRPSSSQDDEIGFRRVFLDLENPPETDLNDLYRYWVTASRTGGLPSRRWFSAESLRAFLPRILILQTNDGGNSFSYRLAGSTLYDVHGYEFTGLNVEDLRPRPFSLSLIEDLRMLVQTRAPQLARLEFSNNAGEVFEYTVLRLPTAEDGETVSQIVVCGDFSTTLGGRKYRSLDEFLASG